MKQITTIIIVLIINLLTNNSIMAQDRERFEITGVVEVQGKKVNIELINLSYSFENKKPSLKDSIPDEHPFYANITAQYSSELIAMLSQLKTINVTVSLKDKFGKNPTRKYEFKDANFNFSESATTYNDEYGRMANLSLQAKSIIIDGNVIRHN
jgi:hypothetical protein